MSMTHTTIAPSDRLSGEMFEETGPVLVALKPFDSGEGALSMAQWLAHKTGSELHLVSVAETEDVALAGPPLPLEQCLRERAQGRTQLRAQAAQGPHGRATCRVDVLEGPPSTTIA